MPKSLSLLRLITLLLGSLLLTACAGMKDRMELLDSAQRAYEGAMRWGHYDIVYSMHRNADNSIPVAPDSLSNYRVTSYTVLSSTPAADDSSANQSVKIKYYHVDYMNEKVLSQNQHWIFYPEIHAWLVTSPPPLFE